jgi:transposase-like protein
MQAMNLTDPIFHDENKARAHLERIRWPEGPYCPHCGNADPEMITKMQGKSHRPGVYQCNECRKPFSVTVGSVMERSHIPLHKWVMGFHLMAASKKGVSAHQLMRTLGLGSYRTAWFMAHRIRECMKEEVGDTGPLGGRGKVIEADETYIGKRETPRVRNKYSPKPTKRGKNGSAEKRVILGLVERGGHARSFHIQQATKSEVREIIVKNVSRQSTLMTDESNIYPTIGEEFAAHRTVKHSAREYVRGSIHTNTIENLWSVFKRGMVGVYQHCGEAHLHRYLAEFDFRYNRRSGVGVSDAERAADAVRGAAGKRLTYQQTGEGQNA